MEINLSTTQFQVAGLANRFRVDSLRDQTLDLMTKQFSARKDHSSLKIKSMFLRKHQSMVTKVLTTQSHQAGLVNRFQADNLRDRTLASTMKQFFAREDHS